MPLRAAVRSASDRRVDDLPSGDQIATSSHALGSSRTGVILAVIRSAPRRWPRSADVVLGESQGGSSRRSYELDRRAAFRIVDRARAHEHGADGADGQERCQGEQQRPGDPIDVPLAGHRSPCANGPSTVVSAHLRATRSRPREGYGRNRVGLGRTPSRVVRDRTWRKRPPDALRGGTGAGPTRSCRRSRHACPGRSGLRSRRASRPRG